ncbi:MAG: ABC transporter permease [Acidobacteriia bacterium]|nr:ABC transporter permease [Terriglobia bacterium]
MRRWRRMWTVATFEFLSTVTRKGYLITTFGMPVFLTIYGAIVAVPAILAQRATQETTIYGVVDAADLLHLRQDVPAPKTRAVFRPIATESGARLALARGAVGGYFVVPAAFLQNGVIDIYTPAAFSSAGATARDSRDAFADLLRERLLNGRVDGVLSARIRDPFADARRFAVTKSGDVSDAGALASALRIVMPLLFMVLFMISVMMTSGYLIQGTALEKENKVVDVLLASAQPDEIMGGKLIGLGGAGLLQIGVWLSLLLIAGVGALPVLFSGHVDVPWAAAALAIPLFPIAFLFYGSLMLGTGSLGSNAREAQQLAIMWSLIAVLPMMMLALLLREPHGTMARVLTWIPTSAATLLVLRASLDPGALAWWDIAGASIVLAASTWVAIRVGARIFRVGLLSSGARPSFREVLRQARLAD